MSMRRLGIATILGGVLLLGAGGSLGASDTPKAPAHARRKAVASKTTSSSTNTSSADVKLDNLYVDSGIRPGLHRQPGQGGSAGLGGRECQPRQRPGLPARRQRSRAARDCGPARSSGRSRRFCRYRGSRERRPGRSPRGDGAGRRRSVDGTGGRRSRGRERRGPRSRSRDRSGSRRAAGPGHRPAAGPGYRSAARGPTRTRGQQ